MGTCLSSPKTVSKEAAASGTVVPALSVEIEVALLTGGFDKPYAFGLALALASKGVWLDVIGSDDVDSPEMHTAPKLNFLNLWGSKHDASLTRKISRVLIYYARLLRYATVAEAKIFHILWNNKFQFLDRTLLMLYYKLLGKKDHVFVHTEKMKRELLQDFGVQERTVSVIPFGINNSVPHTDLTPGEAKQRLGIRDSERTILFFGAIRPYKGLEHLVNAFQQLAATHSEYRLIIAGESRKGAEQYLDEIQRTINGHVSRRQVLQEIRYIPDEETELYFKAADVLALPYTHVFQSGVLFLGYSFGLPVVGADVGSIREEIIEGRTGFLYRSCDSADLAKAIEKYFESDLFKNLDSRRQEIREYANAKHSWDIVGEITREVYTQLSRER